MRNRFFDVTRLNADFSRKREERPAETTSPASPPPEFETAIQKIAVTASRQKPAKPELIQKSPRKVLHIFSLGEGGCFFGTDDEYKIFKAQRGMS